MPGTTPKTARSTRSTRRYILNLIEHVVHEREGLTESCNTDDIIKKRYSDAVPKSYRRCQHCSTGATE